MKTRPAMLAATFAAALFSAAAMPAFAGEARTGQASVGYDDLDLSTEAGRTQLAERFDQAARDICGVTDATKKLHGKERYCFENTSKQLKVRVASIIAEHDAKAGGSAVAAR
jgi:UrcA family protein